MMWAVRAGAMAAGMRHPLLMFTCRALNLHLDAALRAAISHRRQRLTVSRRQTVPVLRQKIRLEGLNDRSQADHLIRPQVREKPSIRPLIRSSAGCWVCSVRGYSGRW